MQGLQVLGEGMFTLAPHACLGHLSRLQKDPNPNAVIRESTGGPVVRTPSFLCQGLRFNFGS